jgi:hypothetical protein
MGICKTNVYSVILDCGSPNKCSIPLPRQSREQTAMRQWRVPAGAWPATFLCLKHRRAYVRSEQHVHPVDEIRPEGSPVPQLWVIGVVCAHENCRGQHTIYTARENDRSQVVRLVLEPSPIMVPCGDHNLIWRQDLMQVTEIAYESASSEATQVA